MPSREWTPSRQDPGRPVNREVELRPYMGQMLPLLDEDLAFFKARYELEHYELARDIQRSDDGRYVLPIHAPTGFDRGVVLRKPWAGAPLAGCPINRPKADTYRHVYGPVQSWYRGHGWNQEPIVIVEDQLSAIKVSAVGPTAVALLGAPTDIVGTYGGTDRVMEIARVAKKRPVIIALDADATQEAFRFARKWGNAFSSLRVAILERDLKDTNRGLIPGVLGI